MTQVNLGSALATLGKRENGTARLEEAVAAYRAALEEYSRERVPLDWATTQNNLGTALVRSASGRAGRRVLWRRSPSIARRWKNTARPGSPPMGDNAEQSRHCAPTLGKRENGTARLEEAVAAYRAALEERTRERVPLQWARTQMNLGIALTTLGEWDGGTARLTEAVTVYRAALEEMTRERVPLEWAQTQNGLGCALHELGQRESGTEKLEEAGAAYRAALQELTRERVPLDWAATQNNLGNALRALGDRESGAESSKAVATYRAALEERIRERVPLDWAMTQNNLGNALRALGDRESGTARLEEAVAAGTPAWKSQHPPGRPSGFERSRPPRRDAGRDRPPVREIGALDSNIALRWDHRQSSCHSKRKAGIWSLGKAGWMAAFAGTTKRPEGDGSDNNCLQKIRSRGKLTP